MAQSRTNARIAALWLVAGCASTVAASNQDATPMDLGRVDASIVDAGALDAGVDVTTDVRACSPIVEDDAPPVDVPTTGGPHVVEVALGLLHQCVRMSDGTARCRGFNEYGALGRGTVTWRELDAAPVPGLTEVAQVVALLVDVTCARHRDGTVRCWGSNQHGLLGTGHVGDSDACGMLGPCRPSPAVVPGLTGVTYLAASSDAVCAVKEDGSLWCWGWRNSILPAGGSATPMRVTAVSDVARLWPLFDGWIVRLRSGRYVLIGVSVEGAAAIAIPPDATIDYEPGPSQSFHVCYRAPDASVRCLGQDSMGELGGGSIMGEGLVAEPIDPGLCGVRSVAVGATDTCALMVDRTVRCWGGNVASPASVAGIDDVEALFLAYGGRCALRRDHSVWCWGQWSPYASPATPTRVEW